MVNPARAERSAVDRALRVGGLTLVHPGGAPLRDRHVLPGRSGRGGGRSAYGWGGAAPTGRSSTLFVQARPAGPGLPALLARRPQPASLLVGVALLLYWLARRGCPAG